MPDLLCDAVDEVEPVVARDAVAEGAGTFPLQLEGRLAVAAEDAIVEGGELADVSLAHRELAVSLEPL